MKKIDCIELAAVIQKAAAKARGGELISANGKK